MSELIAILHGLLEGMGYLLAAAMCLVGLFLSCLSLSGTWLVVGATVLAAFVSGAGFPGFGTVLFFIYLAVLVEVAENVAGFWGVKRRGGSGWAGLAALGGGLIGALVGSLVPVPVVGTLLGMLAGSFGLVYLVELRRLRAHDAAAYIAFGAVLARMFVVLLKVLMTLAMSIWLFVGIAVR